MMIFGLSGSLVTSKSWVTIALAVLCSFVAHTVAVYSPLGRPGQG